MITETQIAVTRLRSKPHSIVRNGNEVIASFSSAALAEEAFNDLGCYLDRRPSPEDQFTIMPTRDIPHTMRHPAA